MLLELGLRAKRLPSLGVGDEHVPLALRDTDASLNHSLLPTMGQRRAVHWDWLSHAGYVHALDHLFSNQLGVGIQVELEVRQHLAVLLPANTDLDIAVVWGRRD